MECSACQFESPDGLKFCGRCGEPLPRACSACGFSNKSSFSYCGECGQRLATSATAAPPGAAPPAPAYDPRQYTPRHLADKILHGKAALEGERKHVTVMFADLADSTALASGIDPELMHALMDRAFQRILTEVHAFEGTVNQFTGDGVMALFGAPIALEDAPRRAIVAALGIHRALATLDSEVRERHGGRFQMRIGIHTGPVIVGKIGDDLRMDYTAVGDTTNLAARLEQLAQPGQVLISRATQRLVEGFFDLTELPPAQVKGKADPIEVFAVTAERAVRGRIESLTEAQLTSYVGRDVELAALLSAMEASRAGRGRIGFIVGDAGIGKSRLLYEFRRRIETVPHTWIEGHCASYARSTPFHAVADAVRRRLGIEDRDDEAAVALKIEISEAERGAGLEWTVPFIRVLLSLRAGDERVEALDALTRRSETGRALLARVLWTAEQQLLVFVIEDLHWMDSATEGFLSYLAESIPGARVLLLLTHRPGYQHPFGDRSYHVRIPLQPLSSAAMNAMVTSILAASQLPTVLRGLIEEKAEGNPLFIEEVLRSLAEDGALKVENGRMVLARDLSDITVPDRIQDVLMARLDRLEEGPKRAIQVASVIGREFALRLLQRISEAGDGLDPIVRELRALELIYEKASHPELAFMFKHALTHDVAYSSVLVARRRGLHEIVGTAIEELYRERLAEHYEALAHHFTEAESFDRALLYHELASEKSAAAYANHAAVEHCQAALGIAARLGTAVSAERRRVLLDRLGQCAFLESDFRVSGEAFESAAREEEAPEARALYLARSGFSFLWSHDYDRSVEIEREGRALAQGQGAVGAHAMCLMVHDLRETVQGRSLDDDSAVEHALDLAERSRDPLILVALLGHAGMRAEWQGEYRRAIALTERAVDIAARERRPGEALFAQWFLGIASVAVGDYGRGLGALQGGLELCDRVGDRALMARLLNTMGWAHAEFGSHVLAAEYNRRGTELARQLVDLGLVPGAPELYANAAINLAGNLTALGDFGAAADQLAPIQQGLEGSNDPWMEWRYALHLDHALARLALARGEADEALSLVERGIRGARAVSAPKLTARALELSGRALLVIDERDRAEEALALALEAARRIEHPPILWRAGALLGELARRRGDEAEARGHFEAVTRGVAERARSLPEPEQRRLLVGLGERLVTNPLGDL